MQLSEGIHIVYEGNVYDTIGGHPVSGINVHLSTCHGGNGDHNGTSNCSTFEIGSSITDASGHFYIKAKESNNPYYFVHFSTNSDKNVRYVSADELKNKYSVLYLK